MPNFMGNFDICSEKVEFRHVYYWKSQKTEKYLHFHCKLAYSFFKIWYTGYIWFGTYYLVSWHPQTSTDLENISKSTYRFFLCRISILTVVHTYSEVRYECFFLLHSCPLAIFFSALKMLPAMTTPIKLRIVSVIFVGVGTTDNTVADRVSFH